MGKCFSVIIPNTYKLNCFIMGPAAVGKTMILYTLKLGEANTRNWNPTPAYNFEVNKQTMSHGAKCEMHMWDLSGSPGNRVSTSWPSRCSTNQLRCGPLPSSSRYVPQSRFASMPP